MIHRIENRQTACLTDPSDEFQLTTAKSCQFAMPTTTICYTSSVLGGQTASDSYNLSRQPDPQSRPLPQQGRNEENLAHRHGADQDTSILVASRCERKSSYSAASRVALVRCHPVCRKMHCRINFEKLFGRGCNHLWAARTPEPCVQPTCNARSMATCDHKACNAAEHFQDILQATEIELPHSPSATPASSLNMPPLGNPPIHLQAAESVDNAVGIMGELCPSH